MSFLEEKKIRESLLVELEVLAYQAFFSSQYFDILYNGKLPQFLREHPKYTAEDVMDAFWHLKKTIIMMNILGVKNVESFDILFPKQSQLNDVFLRWYGRKYHEEFMRKEGDSRHASFKEPPLKGIPKILKELMKVKLPEFVYDKESKFDSASVPFSKKIFDARKLTIDFDIGTQRSYICIDLIISNPSCSINVGILLPPTGKAEIAKNNKDELMQSFEEVMNRVVVILPSFENAVIKAIKNK